MQEVPSESTTEQLSAYTDQAISMAMQFAPPLLLAIVVLVVGLWIINRAVKILGNTLKSRDMEPELSGFLTSLSNIMLKALMLISVAGMVGIETTSFIAILGAAGLAIGLALQGTLANFAGGVLILMFKPYKVGDFIDAQGVSGTVASIQIFNTIIKTGDNKVIIVPNGSISNGIITNFSKEDTRRVDFLFGIGYDDDIAKAKDVLNRLIEDESRILSEPAPLVVVSELADSSVNFTVRTWVNASDYWGVYFGMTERVKLTFDQEGLSIPYPQSDVHMHQVQG